MIALNVIGDIRSNPLAMPPIIPIEDEEGYYIPFENLKRFIETYMPYLQQQVSKYVLPELRSRGGRTGAVPGPNIDDPIN